MRLRKIIKKANNQEFNKMLSEAQTTEDQYNKLYSFIFEKLTESSKSKVEKLDKDEDEAWGEMNCSVDIKLIESEFDCNVSEENIDKIISTLKKINEEKTKEDKNEFAKFLSIYDDLQSDICSNLPIESTERKNCVLEIIETVIIFYQNKICVDFYGKVAYTNNNNLNGENHDGERTYRNEVINPVLNDHRREI